MFVDDRYYGTVERSASGVPAGYNARVRRGLDHPRAEEMTLASVLTALADPVRLGLVRTLGDGAEHTQEDFDAGVGQSTLSHHMKKLREAGVVFSRPEGTRCYLSLRGRELEQRFPGLLAAVLSAADGRKAEATRGAAQDAPDLGAP